jgi:hypothetical protein
MYYGYVSLKVQIINIILQLYEIFWTKCYIIIFVYGVWNNTVSYKQTFETIT